VSAPAKGRDPLSVLTYLTRNVRRILPASIMLASAVIIVVVVLSMLRGVKAGAMRYTREFRVFTVVLPKKQATISKEERAAIRSHPSVERVADAFNCIVRVKTFVGALPYQLRAVEADDLVFLMDRAGLKLKPGGRLPAPDSNEVVMHEWLMAANGWNVGQEFGIDVNEDDWMPGRFKVVGILEGPAPMGFASREFMSNDVVYGFAPKLWERLLVVAKPGRQAEMNAFLRSLTTAKAFDEARAIDEVNESFDQIMFMTQIISVLIMLVVALVVGLLNNIFFAQRIDEFAVLLALGWRRGRLVRKVLGESLVIAFASWLAGLGLALGLMEGITWLLLEPRGIFIPVLHGPPIGLSLLLPAVAMVFSGVTVFRRLTKLDPIVIIERRG